MTAESKRNIAARPLDTSRVVHSDSLRWAYRRLWAQPGRWNGRVVTVSSVEPITVSPSHPGGNRRFGFASSATGAFGAGSATIHRPQHGE